RWRKRWLRKLPHSAVGQKAGPAMPAEPRASETIGNWQKQRPRQKRTIAPLPSRTQTMAAAEVTRRIVEEIMAKIRLLTGVLRKPAKVARCPHCPQRAATMAGPRETARVWTHFAARWGQGDSSPYLRGLGQRALTCTPTDSN